MASTHSKQMKLLAPTLGLMLALNQIFPSTLSRNFKRQTILGTIVAQGSLPVCVYHPCAAWLIVRLKGIPNSQPTYVRVVVEYFPEPNSPNKGYPMELVKSAGEWKFEAVRFKDGDASLERFLRVEDVATKEDISEKTAANAWILLPGAEKEQLPFGEVLRCYQVTNGRYKRSRSSN